MGLMVNIENKVSEIIRPNQIVSAARKNGEFMQKEHLEVILESIDSKFNLVLEGYTSLDKKIDDLAQKTEERFDLVDFKIDTLDEKIDGVAAELKETDARLSKKIDAVVADLKATDARLGGKIDSVAFDLKAHRADTEAHHGVYQVKEG